MDSDRVEPVFYLLPPDAENGFGSLYGFAHGATGQHQFRAAMAFHAPLTGDKLSLPPRDPWSF
jgi:hypothetical protein